MSEHYRADIDGLRAIAVLLVIVHHFDLLPLRGGFIGVDVFFVISGFVITRAIMTGQARGQAFSYWDFLARRLLRLAPGAIAVVAASLALGWFTLSKIEYAVLGRSAFASVLFVANIFFSRRSGYFAPDSETQPLMHMWSLSVEEQFYLIAPLLIVGLSSRPRLRWLAWSLVLAITLALAVHARLDGVSDAYFLLQYRAFELAIGVLLALGAFRFPSGISANIAGVSGLLIIAASALMIDSTSMFPGPWALAPCLGTALVILAGIGWQPASARLLSVTPLVFIGMLSYSLYLWHWPLAAFAKIHLGGSLDMSAKLAVLAAVLMLSLFTHFAIERPLRQRAGGAQQRRWVAVVALSGLACAGFAALVSRSGIPSRLNPALLAHEALGVQMQAKPAKCQSDGSALCLIGATDVAPTFLVWGDSHVDALGFEIDEIAKGGRLRGVLVEKAGCPPVINSATDFDNPRRAKQCTAMNQQLFRALELYPGIKRVVLHARWATYTEPEYRRRSVQLVKDDAVASRAMLAASLAETIKVLSKRSVTITVVGPVPDLQSDPWTKQTRAMLAGKPLPGSSVLDVLFDAFRTKNRHALEVLEQLSRLPGIDVAMPHHLLCSATSCRTVEGQTPFYFDDNHLNWLGARQLRPLLSRAIGLGG